MNCAMQVWDNDFMKVDDETIFNLILAANYLDIKALLDLTVIRIKPTTARANAAFYPVEPDRPLDIIWVVILWPSCAFLC